MIFKLGIPVILLAASAVASTPHLPPPGEPEKPKPGGISGLKNLFGKKS